MTIQTGFLTSKPDKNILVYPLKQGESEAS